MAHKKKDDDASTVNAWLMKEYNREIPWMVKLQSYRTPMLDLYFKVASILGDELFYISFLPLCSWVIDRRLTQHMTILMMLGITSGNMLKNIFCIPRPSHTQVWVEGREERDHGFPSVHSITAITFPYYFFIYYFVDVKNAHTPLVFVLCTWWALSIMISRIYNGHHTPIDVLGGCLWGILVVAFWVAVRELADTIIYNNFWLTPLLFICGGAFLVFVHPSPLPPTPARAESALTIGVIAGSLCSHWFRYNYTMIPHFEQLPHPYLSAIFFYTVRFIFGALVVAVTRTVAKKTFQIITMRVIPPKTVVDGATFTNILKPENYHHYHQIDVVVKYLTYFVVAVVIELLVPFLFWTVNMPSAVDLTGDKPLNFVP